MPTVDAASQANSSPPEVISIIGMAGSGKSYWAQKLADDLGFVIIHCDGLIAEKLSPLLNGDTSEVGMGRWMGMPYEPQYNQAASKYLEYETETLKEVLADIKNGKYAKQKIVIDTTGSVVHTPQTLVDQLRSQTTTVYLETPDAEVERMYKDYLVRPRPIYWDNYFHSLQGEDPKLALARCYKALVEQRRALYRNLAKVIVPYEQYRSHAKSAADFLNIISKK